jgi:uncharacterized protein (TIGR02757 family)
MAERNAKDRRTRLKETLEVLYRRYNHRRLVPPDPLQFVYHYSEPRDMEIAGFLASALAYGRVQQIAKSVSNLLGRMGNSPHDYVRDFGRAQRNSLRDFKHRFNTGTDIADLLGLLKWVLVEYGSIEQYFCKCSEPGDKTVVPALARFCDSLTEMHARKHGGEVSTGLMYLLSSPTRGSACKRLNLFLRWMVRNDDVDAGLWKSVDPAKLIVPVDVHMGRLCRILGLYSQKTVSLAAARKITESFREVAPDDPVKYDFALSRIGIIEDCNGKYADRCRACELYGYCLKRENWQDGPAEA